MPRRRRERVTALSSRRLPKKLPPTFSRYLDLQNLRKMELTRLYYNLFPVRCSYEFALVVRTSSRVVRTLFVRCSYAVRVVVRTLFVRCSYERELTRELRDAPL